MSFIKSVLISTGLSLALATGAVAQSLETEANIADRSGFIMHSTGKIMKMGGAKKKVSDASHTMVMQNATKLAPNTLIYRVGNDLYMLENKKIAGKDMLDHFEWY